MANVLAVRNSYWIQVWVMLIQKCNSSVLTKREISEKSYCYWLRKLQDQMAKEPTEETFTVKAHAWKDKRAIDELAKGLTHSRFMYRIYQKPNFV